MPGTLQVFNVYQQYGGEENCVRTLSRLMQGPDWADLYFSSKDWAMEPAWKKPWQAWRTFHNRSALQQIEVIHEKVRPDIWLFHNVLPVGSAALYGKARQLGVPVIQYLHNYRPFSLCGMAWHGGHLMKEGFSGNYGPEILAGSYRNSRVQSLFMATVLSWLRAQGTWQHIAAWISQSQFQKDLYAASGIDPNRIHVLLPPREMGPPPTEWSDDGFLLFLGRLVPEKGVLFLLEVWEKAAANGLSLPPLRIAGDGPLAQEVRQRSSLLPQVTYLGHVTPEEKQKLLTACRAVVVPSLWWEVLGLVAFEAYEAEKPVLAARTGGLGEIVHEGQSGFAHEPGLADSLLQSIADLEKTSPEDRRNMGRWGRNWLAGQTNPAQWKARYQEIIHHVLADRKT